MSVIVGGLRQRLIKDSLFYVLQDSLTQLGWFDGSRGSHLPINFVPEPHENEDLIPLNTLTMAELDLREDLLEMGSATGVETTWILYVDFYAENNPLGREVINDVRDILAGRIPQIGRDDPSIDVYDYRQATPPKLFSVDLENIMVDRAEGFPKPYQKHWYTCRFDVLDCYMPSVDASPEDPVGYPYTYPFVLG